MPSKAMMKLTAREGCITEKGMLFPALAVLPVLTGSCVLALALDAYCALRCLDAAGIALGPGSMSVPRLVVAGDERETVCVCAGKLVESNVTFSVPVISPRLRYESPGAWPWPMGTRPRRSGRPKVVCPFPPYVVPSRANNAEFCEIAISWPLQNAQPAGAKVPPNIRISPRNGLDIGVLLKSKDSQWSSRAVQRLLLVWGVR